MGHFDRRSSILGDLDVRTLRGLEIGPLHNPLVRKSEGTVYYVDHAKTKVIEKTNRNPRHLGCDVADIDIVWGDRPLGQLVPYAMDYVVASHVIEHVPDMIGWLLDLEGALTPDGVICLAIPDRRFTFDLNRPESTTGEFVEAYLLRARRPPARHVFDQVAMQVPLPKDDAWKDGLFLQLPPREDYLPGAHGLAQRVAKSADYIDAHCWVFTPQSFLDNADRLSRIGLFPFVIAHFQPTEYGHYEFFVRLRTSRREDEIAASIAAARSLLQDSPSERLYRQEMAEKTCSRTLPESEIEETLRRLATQAGQLAAEHRLATDELHYLRRLMSEVRTSTSWRLTWPIRWFGRLLRSARLTRKYVYNPLRRRC
jgi:hypothetical protein